MALALARLNQYAPAVSQTEPSSCLAAEAAQPHSAPARQRCVIDATDATACPYTVPHLCRDREPLQEQHNQGRLSQTTPRTHDRRAGSNVRKTNADLDASFRAILLSVGDASVAAANIQEARASLREPTGARV